MRLIIPLLLIFALFSNTLIVSSQLLGTDEVVEHIDLESETDNEEMLELDFKVLFNNTVDTPNYKLLVEATRSSESKDKKASQIREVITPPPELS
ncbi:MAG: hypothetical protein HRT68_02630 [Flavobacteriaceae bacterium]|nr:hypothetical protein [Flavobacteriaceae bacterium]